MADDTPWFTVHETVQYARSSRTEVHAALRSGELRGYQTTANGKYRIHRDDVDAWVRGMPPAPVNARFSRGKQPA